MNTERPLHFCMITTFYPPYHFGGDAMHIYRLSNALARRGHTVDVICDQDAYHLLHPDPPPGNFPNHDHVKLHALKSSAGFLSPLATQQTGQPFFKRDKIEALFAARKPDVINFHNVSLVGGPGVLFLGDAVKLYTTHEHWLVCPMHVLWKYDREACDKKECVACQLRGKRPLQWWRYTGLLEKALKQIDLFLSPSTFTLKRHTEWGGLPIPMRRLPYYYQPPENAAGEVSSAPVHDKPYFLIVGRLEKIKGIQHILPVFRRYTRADLLIAGEGDYGAELRRQGEGIPGVKFLGRQSQQQLRALYSQAVALIVPSICYEVFGIIIIESFAQRTPVIAHRWGVLTEVIEESQGGLLYSDEAELTAAMDRMLDNPEERRALGERGHACYEAKWSEGPHLDEYLRICHELLAKRGR